MVQCLKAERYSFNVKEYAVASVMSLFSSGHSSQHSAHISSKIRAASSPRSIVRAQNRNMLLPHAYHIDQIVLYGHQFQMVIANFQKVIGQGT
jgi:hypothetical protein